MPYVDVESGNLFAQLGSDSKSNLRVPKCHEIMTRMMRPGDAILEETQTGERATLLVRYILNGKRENYPRAPEFLWLSVKKFFCWEVGFVKWSGRVDLNHRLHGPEPCA